MSHTLTALMAQINPTVGAIAANTDKIIQIIEKQQGQHDLIIFPELAITGYPPEDLLFRSELFSEVDEALNRIKTATRDCHIIVGHPSLEDFQRYNAASIFFQGQKLTHYHKQHLPNYDVFDEKRYFAHGKARPCLFNIKGYQLGLCICEDLWHEGPGEALIAAGAKIMVCINASPFDYKKYKQREHLLQKYAKQGIIILYVNQIGGQDDLVFDGRSLAMNDKGQVCARAEAFTEQLLTVDVHGEKVQGSSSPLLDKESLIYKALICGLRDYVHKNHFTGVLLGLSGGIDSALTLAVAADALGAANVHAVMMPSRYTADMSTEDALLQLQALQVEHSTFSIEPAFQALMSTLSPSFAGLAKDTTEENLQARIRALFLMALSNKMGRMVVSTSNKSETAVGYTTLYGDMSGGFALLKDVLKTEVYALARYRNSISPIIPERVLTRAPSAELSENQTDQDTLPPYPILDAIITLRLEENASAEAIIAQGFEPNTVNRVLKMIRINEYKRRQAPPGVKVTPRAFGKDWRYPITSGM